jgi:hypothetical protein
MSMFRAFQEGSLPLFYYNFVTIIFLLKKENAIQIQPYKPIYLLNVSFKIFTKVVINKVSLKQWIDQPKRRLCQATIF